MQSKIPSFAQSPASNPRYPYPGQEDQVEAVPLLCCASSAPRLLYKPTEKLPFPHEALTEDLIQDLMREKRNFDQQQDLFRQNIGVSLPIPPYIPPVFRYVVEVTTRVLHIRNIRVPEQDGTFGEQKGIGYPNVILASQKPYRWFVLCDENAFHAAQVHKNLARMSQCGPENLTESSMQKRADGRANSGSGAHFVTQEVVGCDSVTKTYVSQDEPPGWVKKSHQFGNLMPIRLKKKYGICHATEPGIFMPKRERGEPSAKKQRLVVEPLILEMERRTWVEIGHDDVSELFDNTNREYVGGLVLKYQCGRAGCLDVLGTEWSFQVLEPVVVRRSRWSIPTHIRYSRVAPSDKYGEGTSSTNITAFVAPKMRQRQRVESGQSEQLEVKSESGSGSERDSKDEDENEDSSDEGCSDLDSYNSIEQDSVDEAAGGYAESENSDGDYDGW